MRDDSFDQRLFGLRVRAPRAIPFATPLAVEGDADLTIRLSIDDALPPSTPFFHDEESPHGRLTIDRLDDGRYLFHYPDGTRFVVDRATIAMTWQPPLIFEDACTYLVGPVLAFVMRLRGAACLHASAVLLDDRAVAIAAPAGMGKSTLAAALVRAGATLLCEDVVPLHSAGGAIAITPSYAGIRLWPASVALLLGEAAALPPISPTWDKRIFEPVRFASAPRRLDAVYFLEWDERGGSIRGASPAEGAMRLVANSYRGEVLDASMRRSEFAIFGAAAATLPLRIVPTAHDRAPSELALDVAADAAAVIAHV